MKMHLISKVKELDDVYSFTFQPEQPIVWKPGQYMHYELKHEPIDSRGAERWFTISSAPFEKNLRITTRMATGEGSSFKKALLDLKTGGEIEADGPKGEFILQEGDFQHILIAGGIGITPYRSMMAQLAFEKKGLDIELFYANRDEKLVFGEELKTIEQKLPSFHTQTFLGDQRIEESDVAGFVAKPNAIFYISGPRPLVENYQHLLETLKVPQERLKTDYFPGYN